jgi:hypothetical protein
MAIKPMCLWCESDKEGKRVDPGKDFICGSCVVMLMSYLQEALQKTYQKCLRLGLKRKANAIETFLEGVDYGRESGGDRKGYTDRGDDTGKRVSGGVRDSGINRETASVRG